MFMRWSTANFNPKRCSVRSRKRAILALLVALFMTAGCSLLPEEQDVEELPIITPPPLSKRPEYVVQTGTIETKVRGVGKIMSMQEEELFFTLEGSGPYRVKEIYVQNGDYVEEGQLIAELDVTDLHNQLRSRKLQFRNDEIEMIRTLRRKNEMSPEEFEQAQIDFEQKRTELLELEEQIERSQLRAPFSGTIVSLSIKRGDTVQAYDPVAVIADLNRLTVAAELSKNDLPQIAVGMDALVDINNVGQQVGKVSRLPVEDSDSDQGGGYPGYPPNQQDRDSIDKYLLVELDPFPEEAVRGTPLSVVIVTERRENVVVVPPSTIHTYGGRTYVQVVEEDGTRREVDVEIGRKTSTQVEIISGLEPGQKVVGR